MYITDDHDAKCEAETKRRIAEAQNKFLPMKDKFTDRKVNFVRLANCYVCSVLQYCMEQKLGQ